MVVVGKIYFPVSAKWNFHLNGNGKLCKFQHLSAPVGPSGDLVGGCLVYAKYQVSGEFSRIIIH